MGTVSSPPGRPVRASLVMLALSLLLFWLPVLGPLIAGAVGGRIAHRPGAAVLIALLPALALGALVWALLGVIDLPFVGALVGGAVLVAVLVEDLPLLVGAYLGAVTAH